MKSFLILFAVYSLSIMVTSCGTNDAKHSENADNAVTVVDYQTVKSGVLHGAGEEGISQGIIAVSNIDELNDLRNKMNAVNEVVGEDIIADERFFEEEMLIFIFDKVRGTGGYTFNVEEITENKETLKVNVLSKSPSGPATSIMTQPYQIVSIAKSNNEITLEIIE